MARLTKEQTGPQSVDSLLAAYVQRAEDWRRDHLGASLIGHECDRFLWLSFRWAMNPRHEGRMLRLFERGQREEAWIVEDLRAAGFEVWDRDQTTGEQFRMLWHGHFGGSVDGVVVGLLEAPKSPHVLEVKTHNAKSFDRLKRDGVKRSKPQHYAQVQVYMLGLSLDRAYYVAVCKDDDAIYTERVNLDKPFAEALVAKAGRIINLPEPPERKDAEFPPCVLVSKDGTRWLCQFFALCHGDGVMPEKNCRTCVSSTAEPTGEWHCTHARVALGPDMQRSGCCDHLTIPAIVNMDVASVDEVARKVVYQAANGSVVEDGKK